MKRVIGFGMLALALVLGGMIAGGYLARQHQIEQGAVVQNVKPGVVVVAVNGREISRARVKQDLKVYSVPQIREIERLYQVANAKWETPEAKASLNELITKYPKANRTGCAVLYLGQMASGAEKETYLKQAIKDFGDCFYRDGVQVGPYARFVLAEYYMKVGKTAEAKALVGEIAKNYPGAVGHKGELLRSVM